MINLLFTYILLWLFCFSMDNRSVSRLVRNIRFFFTALFSFSLPTCRGFYKGTRGMFKWATWVYSPSLMDAAVKDMCSEKKNYIYIYPNKAHSIDHLLNHFCRSKSYILQTVLLNTFFISTKNFIQFSLLCYKMSTLYDFINAIFHLL